MSSGKGAGHTLVLLRHAKAEHTTSTDKKRELAPKGRRQAAELGPLLRDALGRVDLALISSATRTRQTAELLTQGMDITWSDEHDELYDAGRGDVLALLRAVPESTRNVLVVGHEPTVSQLARYLHDEPGDRLGADVRLGVSTATACVLDVPVALKKIDEGRCHLRALIRP